MTDSNIFNEILNAAAGFVPGLPKDGSVEPKQTDSIKRENSSEENSFETPHQLLTIAQAAAVLGKSVRTLERSLAGRWGNKLPEGWIAKKVSTSSGEEWRIVPPPGFRVGSLGHTGEKSSTKENSSTQLDFKPEHDSFVETNYNPRRPRFRAERKYEAGTIVIDRSDEVETLLRELLSTQKALSEERRLHMEDIRFVAQLQGSMRLLESTATENSKAKIDLENTKRELEDLKREYNQVLEMPWWKRLFPLK